MRNFHSHFYVEFHASVTLVRIFTKFSPKCRTKKLGMIFTILGSFCSFLNWEGPMFGPKSSLRKSLNELGTVHCTYLRVLGYIVFFCLKIFSTFTNSIDPDEMQHYAAFHPGLHCLQKHSFRGFPKTKG